MKEKLAVMVDGGLGRVICAIPALMELNKTTALKVIAHGWMHAYTGSGLDVVHYGLPNQASVLEGYSIVKPEPYWELGYRDGTLNLVEAFYASLGLVVPDEVLPFKSDTRKVGGFVNTDKPILVFQPFGSGDMGDPRSMTPKEISEVIAKYHENYAIVMLHNKELMPLPKDKVTQVTNLNEPAFIRYVQQADYFIGCDSAGLHIAAGADVPHQVYLATTSGVKYYPKTAKIIRKGYEDMRINPRL